MRLTRKKRIYGTLAAVFGLALSLGLLAAPGGAAATTTASTTAKTTAKSTVTTSSLGTYTPTFVGPAATGCASGCDLMTGPTLVPSTASFALGSPAEAAAAKAQAVYVAKQRAAAAKVTAKLAKVATPGARLAKAAAAKLLGTAAAASTLPGAHVIPNPELTRTGPDPAPPAVNCAPLGAGCDRISLSAGRASGVKGINAVDSGTLSTNPNGDIEPADQGLCAGGGYVVEANNIGEILIFNTRLHRVSSVISLDTLFGLTAKGWSSGGDISCVYDYSNGGHWIFTEFVSASTEASGGAFSGCFGNVAKSCYEGIAATKGDSPFGPYNVYFVNSNYNAAEPGAPYLLNDFTKIGVTRDAFLMFYDEFPLVTPGIGGGFFNGAQEFAIDKNALERGLPVTEPSGTPNREFNVAIENMGTLATPDGTCSSDNTLHQPGVACWYSVIPALPPDPSQYDNSHGGSGFMLDSLDTYGQGDTRIAVFDWTGLSTLNSRGCGDCADLKFGGQLFSGADFYYFGTAAGAPQKAGPIPLGDECGAAKLSTGTTPPASCPEGVVATNGDNFTEASQAQGQLWGALSTEVSQTFSGESSPEAHEGVAYYVVGTNSFDRSGAFTLTSQGYVSPAHEDLAFPAIAAPDHGTAALFFTLTGDGGPAGADNGGFYPSTAYGRLFAGGDGLLGSTVNVVDLGQSPADGFTEYLGYPGTVRPRWGDYSAGVYDPASGKIFFANNYIQYPNCTGSAFTLTLATCGGTRDDFANWGTSVNAVSP
jgi:hypothetical protein